MSAAKTQKIGNNEKFILQKSFRRNGEVVDNQKLKRQWYKNKKK